MKLTYLLFVFLLGCGEKEIKKVLISPAPNPSPGPFVPQIPEPLPTARTCQLSIQKASLKQMAYQAALVAQACDLDETQLEAMVKSSHL